MPGERLLGHPTSCEELRAVHEGVAGYVGISCRLCRLDPLDGDFDVLQERFGLDRPRRDPVDLPGLIHSIQETALALTPATEQSASVNRPHCLGRARIFR